MYKTILRPASDIMVVKKSKFIAHLVPIASEEQAKTFIERIKKEHRGANHNVPVYVMGKDYHLQRYSDDGEPSGTAGVPVLDMLKKQRITNICCVITRYFGGIKLGTGGLVRAYTEVVQHALHSSVVTVDAYQKITIDLPYHLHGKIDYALANSNAIVVDTTYTDRVSILFYIIESESEAIIASLIELSNNQVVIKKSIAYGAVDKGEFIALKE